MSRGLHVRDTAMYSITKNHLCFICHGKPDKGQEDFDCCCCHLGDPLLCENKCASQQSKTSLNTYSKAPARPYSTLKRCDGLIQQPWRGDSTAETDSAYTSPIITDIAVWKNPLLGQVSYCLQSLPGPQLVSTVSWPYRSEINFYKTYLPSWNTELVWLEFRRNQYNKCIGPCFSLPHQ